MLNVRASVGTANHQKCAPRLGQTKLYSSIASTMRKGTVITTRKSKIGDSSSIVPSAIRAKRVFVTQARMTVAITGATGLVGSRLVSRLTAEGHIVRVLTRNPSSARSKLANFQNVTFFSPEQWSDAIQGVTAVVNLAGEPIATRWTPELKAEIKRSRVNVTQQLVTAMRRNMNPLTRPSVFISASAIGYYGVSETATYDEKSGSGSDYLAQVCREWEDAAKEAPASRNVILRIGIVLAREGGALGKMLPVFQLFAGGPLGSGRQWFSWIHRDDLVSLIMEALQSNKYQGVYNATAPQPVRMSEMCAALGAALGRPSWMPVPGFVLQGLLGEGAAVVLDGQRVMPNRTMDAGFKFKYSNIADAVRNLV